MVPMSLLDMGNSKLVRLASVVTSTLANVLELIASVIFSVILAPVLVVLWLINLIVRTVISAIFYFKAKNELNPKIRLVSDGADAIWGFQKSGNSRNMIILYIYNSRMTVESFRNNFNEKVINFVDSSGKKPYQKLKYIFKKKYGYYCWEECKNFDIENHIISIHGNSSADAKVVSESEVLKLMSSLTEDMDDKRPQWEEIIIPRFAYDDDLANGIGQIPDKSARIYRSHHAFMDGCSNLLMAGTCMGDPGVSFPYVLDPTSPLKVASWKQYLYKVTCVMFGLSTIVKTIFHASRIRSRFIMANYSGKQNFGWSPPIDLSAIKRIKEKTNVSFPAILASATISALTTLEEKLEADVSNSITFGLVGAILPYPDIYPKNRFTVVNFSTRRARKDTRLNRLATTQKDMRKLTRSPGGLVAYAVFQIFGKFPAFMLQRLMGSARTPLIYSNVPWASQTVRLWDQEVNDVAGWMPLLTFAGIGLLSATYADKVRLCIISDDACLSEDEVQFILNQTLHEIQLLCDDCTMTPKYFGNGKPSV